MEVVSCDSHDKLLWISILHILNLKTRQDILKVFCKLDILKVYCKWKWIGIGEFNSDDHYIYYYGQESLRRNGLALTVNKSLKWCTWMQSQKQNDLFISKLNHSISEQSMSVPQPVMLKKLKLNGSMKTYKAF